VQPPYEITPKILKLTADISLLLGSYDSLNVVGSTPKSGATHSNNIKL